MIKDDALEERMCLKLSQLKLILCSAINAYNVYYLINIILCSWWEDKIILKLMYMILCSDLIYK